MQTKMLQRSFAACCVAIALFGTSLLQNVHAQTPDFKPFLTVQLAGPGNLISIAEKLASVAGIPEFAEAMKQAAPYKNMPGVNANGSIGLAIQVSEEGSPFGVDGILALPINNFATFNIPGMEEMIAELRGAAQRQGTSLIFPTPFGNVIAYQKPGILLVATEGAAPFAATADPKKLFADVEPFTFGVHVNLENITEDDIAMIMGPIAMMLAMQGMDVPDLDDLSEAFGPAAEIIAEMAFLTMGATIDPRTLNLSFTGRTAAQKNTALEEKFAKSKAAQAKTKMGAFLPDSPQTIFSYHYLNYFTDLEIESIEDAFELISEGLLEGIFETLADEEEQLEKLTQATDACIEYAEKMIAFLAKERVFDSAFRFDSDGTFLMAFGLNKTDEIVELDEELFNTLLETFGDEEAKLFIEGKIRRNYETVAGYSLSCIPDILSNLPADLDVPEEVQEFLNNISVNLLWGVKENEALVYAVGLDFAKMEQTVKAAIGRTATATPPKQTAVLAMKPLADFLANTWIPLAPQKNRANLDMMLEGFTQFVSALGNNDKITYVEDYPGTAYQYKMQIPGEFVTAYVGMMQQAIGAARGAARRMSCMSHLKELALAIHNYHDTTNSFPPLYTVDANGKPLHSWRTLILPFIEQTALFEAIRFDEPWDSDWNKQFHNVMIPVYSCPDNPLCAPGKACTYSAIAGQVFLPAKEAAKAGQKIVHGSNNFGDIIDGTSNTIAFVEVQQPFCWMDPTADITLDELAKGINKGRAGSFHPNGMNAALLDGSTHFIHERVDGALLRILGDPKSGKSADWQ